MIAVDLDGRRVRARNFNFDGRYVGPNVMPPSRGEAAEVVEGVLHIHRATTPFGSYDQYLVLTDDGRVRMVEPDSVVALD